MAGPELDFDWELGLFKALRALWRRTMPAAPDPYNPATVATAEEHLVRLGRFASLIAGEPLRVETVRGPGGIRGTTLLLPRALDLAPSRDLNLGLYLLRVAVDATTAARGFDGIGAVATLVAAEQSLNTLRTELPRFTLALSDAALLLSQHDPPQHPHWPAVRALWLGEPLPAGLPVVECALDGVLWGALLEVRLPDSGSADGEGQARPPSSDDEHVAKDITNVEVLALTEEDAFEAPIHAFEKVELLETFNGHLRQLDGDDDLASHIEALEEVDLGTMMRGGPQAHAMLRAEVGLDAHIPDVNDIAPDEDGLQYPEWDRRTRTYRTNWCTVYPTFLGRPPSTGVADESLRRQASVLNAVHDALLRVRQERRRRSRVEHGDALDLDAVISSEVARRAGRSPSSQVYSRSERKLRDTATTLLVDISLSADSWFEGRRVWDITRDAVWVLGEAAAQAGDALQILAFASHTRHRVRVFHVLDWHEPWSWGKRRLEHLQPQGYTRIGPALRYATDQLVVRQARARQLVLIGDCKPTDYDAYEGSRGLADVHRALEEARVHGIRPYGLAVDGVARERLPQMFGAGAWSLLHSPQDLVEATAQLQHWQRI